ncbi:MAG: hypothetical protein WCG55_00440 [bacterium]
MKKVFLVLTLVCFGSGCQRISERSFETKVTNDSGLVTKINKKGNGKIFAVEVTVSYSPNPISFNNEYLQDPQFLFDADLAYSLNQRVGIELKRNYEYEAGVDGRTDTTTLSATYTLK